MKTKKNRAVRMSIIRLGPLAVSAFLATAGTLHSLTVQRPVPVNVTTSSFELLWEASSPADPVLRVYSDAEGTISLEGEAGVEFFPVHAGVVDITLAEARAQRRDLQSSIRQRGLLTARVSGLSPGAWYYVKAGAGLGGNEFFAPGPPVAVRTASRTDFVTEALQLLVEFPATAGDGMIATLETPGAAHPLAWTLGDADLETKAFFQLADLIETGTNRTLGPSGIMSMVIRLRSGEGGLEEDPDPVLEFTGAFTTAKVTLIAFAGGVPVSRVEGFVFSAIGTQTTGVPFPVTIRAVNNDGMLVADFVGSVDLAGSGLLRSGGGTTPAFTGGELRGHLVAVDSPGRHYLEASHGADASGRSNDFVVATSYARWRDLYFPTPEEQEDDSFSGPGAIPKRNGIPNLMAYALGLSPWVAHRGLLPFGDVMVDDTSGDQYLTLTYARSPAATDLIFDVLASGDLGEWIYDATDLVEIERVSGFDLHTVRDRERISDHPKRFLRLEVSQGTSFSDWQARHFTGGDLHQYHTSGDRAVPAGDGISNIVKYALGMDPRLSDRSGLPSLSPTWIDGKMYQTIHYKRPAGVRDVDYRVEVSADLVTWHSGPGHTVVVNQFAENGMLHVWERALQPMEGNPQFVRLRVARK